LTWLSKYYDRRVLAGNPDNFLKQVGHTEQGQAITEAQFQAMLADIRAKLNLGADDVLLDLCCGNGVFTQQLALDVKQTLGVDFSTQLITKAKAHFSAPRLEYIRADVKHLGQVTPGKNTRFNKVLMNAALQHFAPQDFENLLQALLPQTTDDRIMLFAFVPDNDQRRSFEMALKPGLSLRLRRLLGRDLMGTWWHRRIVTDICAKQGLKAEFLDVVPSLNGASHRFDIRVF
jgi:cyclopropane fatty-acyl-phospholipid synthase-like methyltransferase